MKRKIFLLFLWPMLLVACDPIAADEQLIEVLANEPDSVGPSAIKRNVLLEDFTGQKCSNCPKGTEIIDQLHEAYGDRLIPVGIHGGPLGFKGTASYVGLATDLGDTYYDHWKLEFQPVGLINRGEPVNYTDWTRAVREELEREAGTRLEVLANVTADAIEITVTAERLAADAYQGRLQVWVLEDGIVAQQIMPDGSRNLNYVHNHVLRTAVNGAWGDEISLEAGETRTLQFSQAIAPAWNVGLVSVVAFLYNDAGVEQAALTHSGTH